MAYIYILDILKYIFAKRHKSDERGARSHVTLKAFISIFCFVYLSIAAPAIFRPRYGQP